MESTWFTVDVALLAPSTPCGLVCVFFFVFRQNYECHPITCQNIAQLKRIAVNRIDAYRAPLSCSGFLRRLHWTLVTTSSPTAYSQRASSLADFETLALRNGASCLAEQRPGRSRSRA